MSANLVVDLANTTDYFASLYVLSGQATAVGGIVDLLQANTYTQVFVAGQGSGVLPILIQTADVTTSGSFTDPTSGLPGGNLPPMPVNVSSGGVFWANSGLYGSGNSSPAAVVDSMPLFASGGITFCAFQRPHRYARLLCTSGTNALASVPFTAGFIGAKKTTGSGGGFTYNPGSGTVSV